MKDFDEFTGAASAKALMSALLGTLDASQISQVQSSKAHTAFLQADPKLAKVLLFTDKNTTTTLYQSLSWAYTRRLACAEVRPSGESGKALLHEYNVTTLPTLLVVTVSGVGVCWVMWTVAGDKDTQT